MGAELEGPTYLWKFQELIFSVGLENQIFVVILFNLLHVLNPWQIPELERWLAVQVGGYVTEYDKLTFSTIRNAGHMVPYTQPARGLHLFESFINKTPL